MKILLEWFLNPDHLPFIAGIQTGAYQKAGLEVFLNAPEAHYDGFEALKKGEIDMHINEPLHLFEHHFEGIKSLGAFFETRGGVMIKKSSEAKLRNNETIQITTPASNAITDKIGFEILKRFATKEGFVLDKKSVEFIERDFYHIKNMQEGDFDGAWLCFYNFEGIEAEHEGLENLFIDQFQSPYANFSALELMSTEATLQNKHEEIQKFIAITNEMTNYIQANPTEAKALYYAYTKESPTALMDKILDDTIPRFFALNPSSTRWRALYEFLRELEIVHLEESVYQKIW